MSKLERVVREAKIDSIIKSPQKSTEENSLYLKRKMQGDNLQEPLESINKEPSLLEEQTSIMLDIINDNTEDNDIRLYYISELLNDGNISVEKAQELYVSMGFFQKNMKDVRAMSLQTLNKRWAEKRKV
ncbi:hypothetical protein [Bacillus sp. NPDC094106]|uniref:hypothetical protein n=1 Tax=Bacillus sp. NPDC094106 TaxID=3363949 RepID=UPI003812ED61